MTDARLLRRFSAATTAGLWLSAALVLLFVRWAGLPLELRASGPPGTLTLVYLALMPLAVAGALRPRIRRALAFAATGDLAALLPLSVEVTASIAIYYVAGIAVWLADAGRLEWAAHPTVAAFLIGLAATLTISTAIPLFIYAQTLFGEYLGPRMVGQPRLPAFFRVLLTGFGIALVVGNSFVLDEVVRAGSLEPHAAAIWTMLFAYSSFVCYLAYAGYVKSLEPLKLLLAPGQGGVAPTAVSPRSLDVIGAVVLRLRKLLDEQRKAQEELRENETRLRMFAESAGDYFFELDENLRASYFSDRFETLTGIRGEQAIGVSAVELEHNESVHHHEQHSQTLRNHEPYRDHRVSIRRADGTQMHLQISGMPYFDSEGKFRGYRGTGTNITQRVEADRLLAAKEAELAQAQKMEAVGQLTGGIAHDFNNLLTVIMGNLELLTLSAGDRGAQPRYTEAALSAAQRGRALVQHLLAFSRRQSLSPQCVDLESLLSSISELLRRTLGENIDLVISSSHESHWRCRIDPHQFESAILNLAINARDAMPGGGRLTLSTSSCRIAEQGSETSAAPGDYVRVVVADSGVGIAPDVLPHVFEPFFTTKRPGEGSGLGLSMVYGFIKQSGGDVRVRSAIGAGTEVELLLPRDLGSRPQADRGTTPARPEGDGQTILIVEDDVGVRSVAEECLTGLGYEVLLAGNGDEALRHFDAGAHIDLVLSDVVLAGPLSGIEASKLIRERHPHTRFLFMTGYGRDEIQRKIHIEGDIDVLHKPFRLADLAERVTDALHSG